MSSIARWYKYLIRLGRNSVCVCAVLSVFSGPALSVTPKLTEADIAIYMTASRQSQFYDVRMDKEERPYLNVADILKNWFGVASHCDDKQGICQGLLPPDTELEINKPKQIMIRGPKYTAYLPKDGMILEDGRLWLRYDLWGKWLPMTVTWSKERYYLTFIPNFPLPADVARSHQLSIEAAKAQRDLARSLAKQKPITPDSPINMEVRYRGNWQPQGEKQKADLTVESDVDVFGGTWYTSGYWGNINDNDQEFVSQPFGKRYFTNYTLKKPGKFDQLQLGDTYAYNDLLLPYINLQYGLNFARLKPEGSTAGGFRYQGFTMPNIEVDVYRNGLLQSTQFSNANGAYSISQPFAVGGDIFEMRFYFADGTVKKKTVVVSDDQGMIVAKNNWDVQAVNGEMFNNKWFTHVDYRYGITNDLTLGAHFLQLPINDQQKIAGIGDFGWRPKPWFDLLGEDMLYSGGNDLSLRGEFTYFRRHNFQFQSINLGKNSPIPALQELQPTTFITPYTTEATRSLTIRDIYDYKTWRVTTEYINNNIADTVNLNINGAISNRFAATVEAGGAQPKNGDVRSGFFTVAGDWSVGVNKLLQFQRTFMGSSQGSTGVSFRFQGTDISRWDIYMNVVAPDKGVVQVMGTLNYRPRPWFIAALTGRNRQFNLQLTLQDIISQGYQYKTYDDFASGTIIGVILAPPLHEGDPRLPIPGAIVHAAGRVATTDQQGQFVLTGVPTDEPVKFSVDDTSLGADLIPDKQVVMMRLRPSTTIHYNPKIDYNAGLDGVLIHAGELPHDAVIVAKDYATKVAKAHAVIENDGFFIVNGLTPGKYYLHVASKTLHIPDKVVDIPQNMNWLSDVKLYWHVKPAEYAASRHPLSFAEFLEHMGEDGRQQARGIMAKLSQYCLHPVKHHGKKVLVKHS